MIIELLNGLIYWQDANGSVIFHRRMRSSNNLSAVFSSFPLLFFTSFFHSFNLSLCFIFLSLYIPYFRSFLDNKKPFLSPFSFSAANFTHTLPSLCQFPPHNPVISKPSLFFFPIILNLILKPITQNQEKQKIYI